MPKANESLSTSKVTFELLVRKSRDFESTICKFPSQENRIANFNPETIEGDAIATRVTTHDTLETLACKLLLDFQHRKNPLSKVHSKQSVTEMWQRLLTKRLITCWLPSDSFVLRNGEVGWGTDSLVAVGTKGEQAPLLVQDYLCSEEVHLASFIQISSPVHFINNGAYPQTSLRGLKGSYQERGICIGVGGPKIDNQLRPDWWHMVITPEQNTVANGYGSEAAPSLLTTWAEFYGQGGNGSYYFPTFDEACANTTKFLPLESPRCLLNVEVFRRRLFIAVETALLEAEFCARREGRAAVVHLAPIGLDRLGRGFCARGMFTWGAKQLVESVIAVIESHTFEFVEQVHFEGLAHGVVAEHVLPQGAPSTVLARNDRTIQLSFVPRKFAAPLPKDKLLIVMYSSDSAALVGNEYWIGHASFSNSSAVAAISTIPELHNPYINPMISGGNVQRWPQTSPPLTLEFIADQFQYVPDKFPDIEALQKELIQLGLGTCNLIIGFDYTASNKDQGRRTFGGKSLHHIDQKVQNPYQQVTAILAKTLQRFDDDNLIPAFGFGDYETSDKDVFPFFPDNRPCQGLDELLAQYTAITPRRILAGPTNFAPLIDKAVEITKQEGGYHILVVVADGRVTEEEATVEAIRRASRYPLSIICVGVGDGPWDQMEDFDDRITDRVFDNFQFVDFHKIVTNTQRPETSFAHAALMEIPQQYFAIKQLGLLKAQHKTPDKSLSRLFEHFTDKYSTVQEVTNELEAVGLHHRMASFIINA